MIRAEPYQYSGMQTTRFPSCCSIVNWMLYSAADRAAFSAGHFQPTSVPVVATQMVERSGAHGCRLDGGVTARVLGRFVNRVYNGN